MLRCVTLAAGFLAASLLAAALPAAAQVARVFPRDALRGELIGTQPPDLLIDGHPARLAPGARIRDETNLMQVSGALANRRVVVHYTLDIQGQVRDVWILNAAERANRPWPRTPEEAASWQYNGQSWSRP